MNRIISFIFLVSLLLTACSTSVTPVSTNEPMEETPAPYPDTPSPAEINAPLVESPSLISINFVNSLEGWGVTETQIVRTNDGGITWYNVTPPNVTEAGYNVDIFVLNNESVWIHLPSFENYPNSGFLYRTADGGLTWTLSNTPFSRVRIKLFDPANGWALADLGVGAGSNAVAVYQTLDGGNEWQQKFINDPNNANASDSLPLGGLKYGIASPNMDSAWIYGIVYSPGSAYLYRTDNTGYLWNPVSIPLPTGADESELTIEQVRFFTPNNAFLAMRLTSDSVNLAVYTSGDDGSTWSLTPTLIPNGGTADFLSAEEAVIYNGSQFYVTRDAARTWSIVPPDIDFSDTFLAMDFVDPSTGWLITVDPTTNHRSLYKTGDGGATWFPVVP